MASEHRPTQHSRYIFDPNHLDGYEDLRHPISIIESSKTLIYWQWFLYSQKSAATAGDRSPEISILLNHLLGRINLVLAGQQRERDIPIAERFVFHEGETFIRRLWARAAQLTPIAALFESNELRYVDGNELAQLDPADRSCPACLQDLSLIPSDDWLEPFPVPTICYPEFVKLLPLGKDDRMKFTGMLTEIWERINRYPEFLPQETSDSIEALEICCKHLGLAINTYAGLSSAEKECAEIQKAPHLKSDRSLEVGIMMYNERRANARNEQHTSALEAEEEIPIPEQTVETACGHRFGIVCLGTWLINKNNYTCPLCRRVLLPAQLPRLFTPRGFPEYFERWYRPRIPLEILSSLSAPLHTLYGELEGEGGEDDEEDEDEQEQEEEEG